MSDNEEMEEVVFGVRESIMNEVFDRLGHIIHPTILYTGDDLEMAKKVIRESRGQAECIKKLLAAREPFRFDPDGLMALDEVNDE